MEKPKCVHDPIRVDGDYWVCIACDELYSDKIPTGQPCPKCGKQGLLVTTREWASHWRCRLCGMILGRSGPKPKSE